METLTIGEYNTQESTTLVQDKLDTIESYTRCKDLEGNLVDYCFGGDDNNGEGSNVYIYDANGHKIHKLYFRLNTAKIHDSATQPVKDLINALTVTSTKEDVDAVFKAYIDGFDYVAPVGANHTYEEVV